MNIDNLIDEVAEEAEKGAKNPQKLSSGFSDQTEKCISLDELLKTKPKTEEEKTEIYFCFKNDIEIFIDDFLSKSKDPNASNGMIKCYLETWQACANEIGLKYFNKNRYLRKYPKGEAKGGAFTEQYFDDELLEIALKLYEDFCKEFRKQFFIYDLCNFCGMNYDSMYRLSELRADLLKKGHTAQESSMRSALASGRSNVTAMAILLNHDYDYTRTTQVIHTTEANRLKAENLPTLEAKNDVISCEDHNENL